MGECDVGRALAVSAKKPIRSNLAPPHSPLRKLAGQHIPQVGVTTSLRPATDSYVAEPGCCNRYQLEAAAVSVNRASGPMPATSPPIAFAAAPGARRSTAKGRPSSLQTHASPPPAAFSTRTAPSRYAPHRREVGPTWQGRRKRLGRIAPLSPTPTRSKVRGLEASGCRPQGASAALSVSPSAASCPPAAIHTSHLSQTPHRGIHGMSPYVSRRARIAYSRCPRAPPQFGDSEPSAHSWRR
jgi:hypothetical protein